MDPNRTDEHVLRIARMTLGDQHEQLNIWKDLGELTK